MHNSNQKLPLDTPLSGYIQHWNDAKGYGFIHQDGVKKGIFFHISNLPYHHHRPKKGDQVCFIAQQNDGRYSAKRVVFAKDADKLDWDAHYIIDHHRSPHLRCGELLVFGFIALFFLGVLAVLSTTLALTSAVISVLTFMLYALDKKAAITQTQRIPEASLHVAALLGGWPGALIARQLLYHKTKKKRFIIFFWLSVVVNFFALYLLIVYLPIALNPDNPLIKFFS
ncbi:DUF1294 domain-containing protein [Suttonella sp. R2A3]|uniref:DUF1294 domain-containing protein n=1 Tax=Suttonella sp. R2A3 TaxID=2908648 RepID=UPI001F2C7527|nr:DUF1294 domain-containing protein [Suttonella sp. R2A3]UJF25405.1 DUF1294 domain-containing protein [Suttonella sp. R2A3]